MEMESSKECPVFFLWTKAKLLDRKLFIEEFNFVLFMLNPLLNLNRMLIVKLTRCMRSKEVK